MHYQFERNISRTPGRSFETFDCTILFKSLGPEERCLAFDENEIEMRLAFTIIRIIIYAALISN